MPYNEPLAQRMRILLAGQPGLTEKKMFGGVGFMLNGNLACGVHAQDLIVRVGPERYTPTLARPHTHPFDMTGRPMTGWVTVESSGYESDAALQDWVRQGIDFARTLPAK
jgi:TfoX/Sxy family transcriptional regulator of competence genes